MGQRASQYWSEFGNTTGLYNFSFLFRSKGKVEKLFWLLASAVGIWYTCEDVMNSINAYMSFPTATKVKVFNNDSIELTDLTMCVDFDVARMKPNSLDLSNATEIHMFLENNSNLDLIEVFAAVPKTGANANETLKMFSLVVGMITSIVRAEQLISVDKTQTQWGFPTLINASTMHSSLDFSTQESMITVNNWLQSRYNYSNLLQSAGLFLCRMINVQLEVDKYINDTWEKDIIDPCELQLITYLGLPPQSFAENEVFCLKLKSEYFNYKSPAENTIVTVDPDLIYNTVATGYSPASYVYLNFHETFLSQRAHNLKYIFFESVLSIDVQILGDYRQLHKATEPCGHISTQLCQMQCRSEFIEQKCKCRPLSFANPTSYHLPNCGQQHFEGILGKFVLPIDSECFSLNTKFQPNPNCSAKCIPKCNQVLYGLTMVKDKSLRGQMGLHLKDKSKTIFSVNIEAFKYPLIEEFPLLSAKDFFTSLGGNLSLYLGASFIVLLHIFVFLINVITAETQHLVNKSFQLKFKMETVNK